VRLYRQDAIVRVCQPSSNGDVKCNYREAGDGRWSLDTNNPSSRTETAPPGRTEPLDHRA
jgi:hypothetical protein